ncbi:MAG: hypothetical protein Kow0069_05060 [Promethearchaeota archaeon]
MAPVKVSLLVVGAGHAGVCAVEEFHRYAPRKHAALVDPDPDAFYFRAALKFFVKGELEGAKLAGRGAGWAKRNRATLVADSVDSIDHDARVATLGSGELVEYEKLVLATGAEPFVPPVEGSDLPGVLPFRSLGDARAIRERASELNRERDRAPVAVVGAGVLGLELAEALAKLGVPTTLICDSDYLAPRLLDRGAARVVAETFREHGVEVLFGERVKKIERAGSTGLPVSPLWVTTESGRRFEASAAYFCTGVRPKVGLAKGAGFDVGRGVLVDDHMRASAPGAFAAGDCAELRGKDGEGGGLLQLWAPAGLMGRVAGRNAASEEGPRARFSAGCVHVYTMLFDKPYHALGEFAPGAKAPTRKPGQPVEDDGELVEMVRPDSAPGDYFKMAYRGNRLVGVVALGEVHDPLVLKRAIEAGAEVPPGLRQAALAVTFDYERLLY